MIRMSKKLISLFLIFCMLLPILTTSITANAVSARKPRIVILRLDDLKANDTNFENFDKAKEILDKYGANAGFGIIAESFATCEDASAYWKKIKEWNADGIEIWHHGYYHKATEYSTATYDEQYEAFKLAQDLVYNNTGIEMVSFAPPGNSVSETFVEMITNEFPNYETLLFTKQSFVSDKLFIPGTITPEESTGRPTFEKFISKYNELSGNAIAMYMHAPYFNDEAFIEFEKIIKYLSDEGVNIMTPHEYHEYVRGAKATIHSPLIEFNSSSDVDTTTDDATVWCRNGSSHIEYNENGYVRIFKDALPTGSAQVYANFTNDFGGITTSRKMVVKAKIHPGDIRTKMRLRYVYPKDNGDGTTSDTTTSVVLFKVDGGIEDSLAAYIGNSAGSTNQTTKWQSGIVDVGNDGWLDCTAVIDMDITKTAFPITVYYDGVKKATAALHESFTTAATNGQIFALNLQNDEASSTSTYVDDTMAYSVESANLPVLTAISSDKSFIFSNEVMIADLVNSTDNTLSVIKVNGEYIPLSEITNEKGGSILTINSSNFVIGENLVDLSEVKDIFGNNINGTKVFTVLNKDKKYHSAYNYFDSTEDVKHTTNSRRKWYGKDTNYINYEENGYAVIFGTDGPANNRRIYADFGDVPSPMVSNRKMVFKAQIHPGDVSTRMKLRYNVENDDGTLTTKSHILFVAEGTKGNLTGRIGSNEDVSGDSTKNNESYAVNDIYDGWIDGVAVIDMTTKRDSSYPVTVYLNSDVKLISSIYPAVSTSAIKGDLVGLEAQNGDISTGQTYLDNTAVYSVSSTDLVPLNATVSGSKIVFSNEVMKADLINSTDSKLSVIKSNGEYLPLDALTPQMGGLAMTIDDDYLTAGDNIIDLSEVKDILGSSVSASSNVLTIIKHTKSKIYNMPLDDFSDSEKVYPVVTGYGYETEWSAPKGHEVTWQEGDFARIFNTSTPAWSSQARRKFVRAFPDERTTSYQVVGKMAVKAGNSGICLRLTNTTPETPETIGALFKMNSDKFYVRKSTNSLTDATMVVSDIPDLYNGWYEFMYVIDVDEIGDATSTSYPVTMYINGVKQTTTMPSTFFMQDFTAVRFQTPVANTYTYIDDTEVYTVVDGYIPDFVVENHTVTGGDIHFDVSNEVTINELIDANDSSLSVIEANGVKLPIKNIKVDRDSLGFIIEEEAFDYVVGNKMAISVANVGDILGNTMSGATLYEVTLDREISGMLSYSTKVDGLFKGGNSYKLEKTLINHDLSPKQVNVIAAIYDKSNNLCMTEIAPVTEILAQSEATFTVSFDKLPQNADEYYTVKLFIWDEKGIPYFAAEEVDKYKQIVLLKFDDLQGTNGSITAVQRMVDNLKGHGIVASFGVIGDTFDNDDNDVERLKTVKGWYDEGFEIWHHGYYHGIDEYPNSYGGVTITAESMKESFGKTMKIFADAGIPITSFGSPHNNAGTTCVQMLEENFPEIEVLLKVTAGYDLSTKMFITNSLYLENEGIMDYEYFLSNYDPSARGVFVAQAHVPYWDDTDYAAWEKALAVLKGNDVMFMTPHQYYTWTKWKENK